jgi:4-diphosphocytidyl-2-C-methyl-D-erythritol kinase
VTEPLTERAHAKLNVFLRVLGRRDDGFHDVETVILPLDLYDVVTVAPAGAFSVEVTGPGAKALDALGGETLASRAVGVFARVTGIDVAPLQVTIDKRVPVAAGLGGGSADAAAVLRALGRMHGVGDASLLDAASSVGSDVVALVYDGPVFASGRGESVHPIHAQTTSWVVLPFPFPVRAADAYGWWDEDGTPSGPDAGALIAAVETGNDELTGHAMFDDLQAPVGARHPEIADAIDAFLDAGALGAIMTGSGPTVVALARHVGHAETIAARVPGSFVATGPPRTMTAPSGVV